MKIKPHLIGIAGGSASGKSTLASKLESCFRENAISVKVVSMDLYFLPENNLPVAKSPADNTKEYRDYNHPNSFNLALLNRDIDRLIQSSQYSVIIVEGLLTLYDKVLASKLDLKLFVDCRADERIVRRLRRNMQWGLSFDEIADVYLNLVRYRHDEFVEPTKSKADFVINGSSDFDKACSFLYEYVNGVYLKGTYNE